MQTSGFLIPHTASILFYSYFIVVRIYMCGAYVCRCVWIFWLLINLIVSIMEQMDAAKAKIMDRLGRTLIVVPFWWDKTLQRCVCVYVCIVCRVFFQTCFAQFSCHDTT